MIYEMKFNLNVDADIDKRLAIFKKDNFLEMPAACWQFTPSEMNLWAKIK